MARIIHQNTYFEWVKIKTAKDLRKEALERSLIAWGAKGRVSARPKSVAQQFTKQRRLARLAPVAIRPVLRPAGASLACSRGARRCPQPLDAHGPHQGSQFANPGEDHARPVAVGSAVRLVSTRGVGVG